MHNSERPAQSSVWSRCPELHCSLEQHLANMSIVGGHIDVQMSKEDIAAIMASNEEDMNEILGSLRSGGRVYEVAPEIAIFLREDLLILMGEVLRKRVSTLEAVQNAAQNVREVANSTGEQAKATLGESEQAK